VVESNLDNNVLATVLTAIGIAGALIMVMGLATIRTVYLIQGKKAIVFILAFFESLLNILVILYSRLHMPEALLLVPLSELLSRIGLLREIKFYGFLRKEALTLSRTYAQMALS
jgi:hypothetical protein